MENDYIDRVLAGDTNAFSYFVKRYQQMALTIAFRISQSQEEAEEIVQDAFVKAFNGLHRFRRASKFSSWLYQIVVNEALSRTRKRKLDKVSIDISELKDKFISNASIAIENLEQEEKRTVILKILARMKPKERLILQLFYLDEYSIQEIEEITSFTKSNIKVLLHRARKSFQKFLNPIELKTIWV